MGATRQLPGVGNIDDEWLCYMTVLEGYFRMRERQHFRAYHLWEFLVEKAAQAYQLVISGDDCDLSIASTGFQQDDLPHMASAC
jgi:hypothetical protein